MKASQVREDLRKEIAPLRDELKTITNKLYDELYRELNLLHMANQERQDLERALHQANLDASTARIDGAIEAATVKLRSEFDVAGDELRDEFRDALDRLPVVDPERRHLERALIQTNLDARDARIAGAIEAATVKLRSEFDVVADKLRDELRGELNRPPVVDQQRREHENALNQTNLDARDARIAGDNEAAIVKLRSEFDVTGDKLRDEFDAATSKLQDEINTRLARLPLEVKTWEPVGEALDQIRQQAHGQARSELHAAVATLRDEFKTATSELHNEINTRLARLPLVKAWEPDAVHYTGDVVSHDGSVYQARKDTGKEPGHQDWILLARAGRDGCDGCTPNVCGIFDAYKTYARLDIVECDGASYLARRDDPGFCPGDGWQILSRPGRRGDIGEIGPRGRKGERGAHGKAAPFVINWTLDRKNYRAIPTMSDGRAGKPLELRGLFEQFFSETTDWPSQPVRTGSDVQFSKRWRPC
jgi:hypothetical protein